MLKTLFAILIFLVILIIIKIVVPMYRFLNCAYAVFTFYDILKATSSSEESHICINFIPYTLEAANISEAYDNLEHLIHEALFYYDELGWIATVDDFFKIQKSRLIEICSEIRTLRWKKE